MPSSVTMVGTLGRVVAVVVVVVEMRDGGKGSSNEGGGGGGSGRTKKECRQARHSIEGVCCRRRMKAYFYTYLARAGIGRANDKGEEGIGVTSGAGGLPRVATGGVGRVVNS